MDSPDQGAKGIAATINYLSADSIAVSVTAIDVSYNGKLQDGEIKGQFAKQFHLPTIII